MSGNEVQVAGWDDAGQEVTVLKWAAGCPVEPDATAPLDEELLLRAMFRHRLDVRFQDRVDRDDPPWASPSLRAAIADLVHETENRIRLHHTTLAEFARRFADAGRRPPVVLKGVTAHLLTGLDRARTRSVDLDLIDADPAGLVAELVALGFAVDDKDPPLPHGRNVRHEYAKLRRGDCQVDVHAHFPVWAYADLPEGDASAHREPGARQCAGTVVSSAITAEQILRNSTVRTGARGGEITLATVEMAVLVNCCHMFANHLVEFPAPTATIRLAELANVADMMESTNFDTRRFEALVRQCGAHDAVAFARYLIRTHLSRPSGVPDRNLFPRDLWWAQGIGGFIVATADVEPPDNLLIRRSELADLVAWLGAATVHAGRTADGAVVDIASGAGSGLGHHLVPGGSQAQPIKLRVGWGADSLTLRVSFVGSDRAELNLLVQAGNAIIECVRHPDGQLFAYDRRVERRMAAGIAVAVTDDPDGETIEVRLPWDTLDGCHPDDTVLPVILGARRWALDGLAPVASTLVPMHLHRYCAAHHTIMGGVA